MRSTKPIAVLAIIVPALAAAPGAQAAPKRAKLKVSTVTPPPQSVAATGSFTVRATVVNRGRKAGKGTLRLVLVRGPRPFQVGLVRNVRVKKKANTRLRIRLTVPGNAPAGGYRLRTCIRPNGSAKSSCYRSRPLVVTGAPAPEPTATATPTASPAPTATPAPPLSEQIRDAVTVDGMMGHLRALQDIATANDGNRAAGTTGNAASIEYVRTKLRDAGYTPQIQTFAFTSFEEVTPSLLERTVPGPTTTVESATADGSPSGDVTAQIQTATPNFTPPRATGTDGCEAADFAGKTFTGRVALIQRGTCTLAEKVANADEAGAIAVVFFNAGDDATDERNGIPGVTAGEDVPIPVVNVSYADGEALGTPSTLPTVHVKTDTRFTETSTANVIAETPGGNPDRTVVVGSHLDSVPAGPGINDDGSGSAFNLELALQMAKLGVAPKNKVRFAFFGAEEAGLLGSYHYVDQLSVEDARKISAMLDFDMLASPNYARFVYDGDGSTFEDVAGPAGSGDIEKAFNDQFASRGLATEPIPFDGRSDYDGFTAVGIPAGGIFAGAEEVKSQEQVDLFGGIPDLEFDPNYHESGDTIRNINRQGYAEHAAAAASVSGQYAFDRDLAPPRLAARAARRSTIARGLDYRGPKAIR